VSDEVIEECLCQRLEEEEVHEAIYQIFNPVLRLIFVIDLRSLYSSGHWV
jgi:hypothetical protein